MRRSVTLIGMALTVVKLGANERAFQALPCFGGLLELRRVEGDGFGSKS